MAKILARFAKDKSGVTAVEYSLIAALAALAIITGVSALDSVRDARLQGMTDCRDDTTAC